MSESAAADVVIVFLKDPAAGRVKTRLAARTGHARAVTLYRQWVGEILLAMQPLRAQVRLVGYYEGCEAAVVAGWGELVDDWWPQPEGDLGSRLDHAFHRAHAVAGRVVAIGTDCLDLDADLVREAFDKLRVRDVVLGPTQDGGYYLIGTGTARAELFDNIRWSTGHTFDDQVKRCRAHGCSIALLPARRDIDTWDDWLDYCRRHGRVP